MSEDEVEIIELEPNGSRILSRQIKNVKELTSNDYESLRIELELLKRDKILSKIKDANDYNPEITKVRNRWNNLYGSGGQEETDARLILEHLIMLQDSMRDGLLRIAKLEGLLPEYKVFAKAFGEMRDE